MAIRTIFNILWLILGGLVAAVSWWITAVIMVVTIVGIPWARSAFVIGKLSAWPFGKRVVDRKTLTGADDIGTGKAGTIGNVVWFVFAGIWLAIGHVMAGIGLFVTLIGIPFAFQHFKLAGLAITPIGKTVVDA